MSDRPWPFKRVRDRIEDAFDGEASLGWERGSDDMDTAKTDRDAVLRWLDDSLDAAWQEAASALDEHTPWARAVSLGIGACSVWMACHCGWNAKRDAPDGETWNEHFLRALAAKLRERS